MKADRSLLLWGGALLLPLALCALAAPLLSGADPAAQHDPVAGRYLPPGSSRFEIELADGRTLLGDEAESTADGVRLERLGESRLIPRELLADPKAGPRVRSFPLGSDGFGRDLLSRLLHGARVSLVIGLLSALLALALGVLIGGIAAMAGGLVDDVLMRLVDALLAFPRLFLVIALAAVFEATEWVVILVLGATGWMAAARLTRAEILALRRRDFILAADAVGQSPRRVFFRHLLPNALTPLIVHTTLRVGDIILVEASLSFLGLGVQPPNPSWGNMVAEGSEVVTTAWWVSALPGAAIALTVIGFNLVGDGLRDYLDPRSEAPGR